jgi:hypothetical protein
MSSYVPGFEHDVLVSYAHIDNEAAPDQEGWVSRFAADLKPIFYSWRGWMWCKSLILLDTG